MRHDQLYTDSYYATHAAGSARSARVVLTHLFHWFTPRSVVDFGCGQGAWLAAAEDLGSPVLVGFDGPWVNRTGLVSPTIQFRPADLETHVELSGRYDLCISVEVAEHLAASCAPSFVELLCRASDLVLFSAATPHQSGDGHVHLRWPSYWAGLFTQHRFECFDVLRPLVWDDGEVEWWYRQNILLFAKGGTAAAQQLAEQPVGALLDVVHPEHLTSIISEHKEQLRH